MKTRTKVIIGVGAAAALYYLTKSSSSPFAAAVQPIDPSIGTPASTTNTALSGTVASGSRMYEALGSLGGRVF